MFISPLIGGVRIYIKATEREGSLSRRGYVTYHVFYVRSDSVSFIQVIQVNHNDPRHARDISGQANSQRASNKLPPIQDIS